MCIRDSFASIAEAVLAVPYEEEALVQIGPGLYREKLICEKRCITLDVYKRQVLPLFAAEPQPGVLGRGGQADAGLEGPERFVEKITA